MIDCPDCGISSRAEWGTCPDCGTALNGAPQASVETPPDGHPIRREAGGGGDAAPATDELKERRRRVIVTTTPAVDGHEVIEHIGPVSAVSILPINSLADWATNARAWFEEGPKDHVRKFETAQDDVEAKLQHMAVRRGAKPRATPPPACAP